MLNKNDINYSNNSLQKKLSKKDFSIIYGLTFIIYFFGIYYSKNQSIALIIVGCASVFPLMLYFFHIAKKLITESIANKYFGILGMYNAFICAVLLSYQASNTLVGFLKRLFILSTLIVIIIVLQKIIFNRFFKKKKQPSIKIGALFVLPFSIIGVLLSKHIQVNSISTLYEILMCIACIIFAMFYLFLMKHKSIELSGQSEDGSMIDD